MVLPAIEQVKAVSGPELGDIAQHHFFSLIPLDIGLDAPIMMIVHCSIFHRYLPIFRCF